MKELIYLCGVIPVPGESAAQRGVDWRIVDPAEWQVDNGDGSFSISPEGYRRHVAQDADPATADEVIALLRPQFLRPFLEPCPLETMPSVPRRYILCTEDTSSDQTGRGARRPPASESSR